MKERVEKCVNFIRKIYKLAEEDECEVSRAVQVLGDCHNLIEELYAENQVLKADKHKDNVIAALRNTLEAHHNFELAQSESYPATSLYIATEAALQSKEE